MEEETTRRLKEAHEIRQVTDRLLSDIERLKQVLLDQMPPESPEERRGKLHVVHDLDR